MFDPNAFYVLDADKQWARARIAELEKAINELGPEFEEALTQSSETWHDNAPFDALRDRQSLMAAERHTLREVLNKAAIACPKPGKGKVGLGSTVHASEAGKKLKLFIAGNWSPNVGQMVDGMLVISCGSPLGKAVIGTSEGQLAVLERPPRKLLIELVAA